MKTLLWTLCIGLAGSVSSTGSVVELTDLLTSVFVDADPESSTFGSPLRLCQSAGECTSPLSGDTASALAPLWSATFVQGSATFAVDSSSPNISAKNVSVDASSGVFLFTVPLFDGEDSVQVRLGMEVSAGLVNLRFAFTFGAESKGIGLWSWSCSIDGADVSSDPSHSSVFENAGFGVVHRGVDSFRDGFQGNYPQRTLQFLALYHEGGEGNTTTAPGLYFATHDPHGSIKSFVTSLNAFCKAYILLTRISQASEVAKPGFARSDLPSSIARSSISLPT